MATQAYIEDGYSDSGFMKEVPGIYQACRFRFRPVLATEVRTVLDGWSSISPEVKSERIYRLIEKHVEEWDLNHKGRLLPINSEVLERLKQPFVDRLFNIITYSDLSDEETKAVIDRTEADSKN